MSLLCGPLPPTHSLQLPPTSQGSSFGWLAALSALGGVIGNLAGTRLYPPAAVAGAVGPPPAAAVLELLPVWAADALAEQRETLPFLLCGGLLALTAAALVGLAQAEPPAAADTTAEVSRDGGGAAVEQAEVDSGGAAARMFGASGKAL